MKNLISLIFCFLCLNTFAQSEAANWYFGYGAGIKFNQTNGTITTLNNGQLFTHEGCTSISDDSGNLLFYTDGTYIWNKNHDYMFFGTGLLGDASSTQSALIVPKPGDSNIFYVFTVGSNQSNTGLHYSIVDMTLQGGLGAVTQKNIRLLNLTSEKVTAVLKDCISKSMWVVTFAAENGNTVFYNTFHAFEVSSSGVSNTSVKSSFPIAIEDARGAIKLSPDGTKLACANLSADHNNASTKDELFLYDFDTATGIVSNSIELKVNGNNHNPYGLEFSPNSQLLYVNSYNNFQAPDDNRNENNNPANHRSTLTQFNLNSTSIQSSQIVIDERQLYRGGLQLGPDGRIYRALSATYGTGLPYLGVISNPNNVGLDCNYVHNAIELSPNQSAQGLPPFIQSLFNTQIDIIKNGESQTNLTLCEGDSYTLESEDIPGANYKWFKNGIELPDTDFDLVVTKSGHYEIVITPNNGDCEIEGQAYINVNPKPSAYNYTLLQCDDDGVKDGLTTFNLNQANGALVNNVATSLTKFYLDPLLTQEIDGNAFNNTSNPQTIYVEITNSLTGCTNSTELVLQVSVTDANDVILPAVCDDDGVEDGLHVFNLKDAEPGMLNGISAYGLKISYYETYDDALLEKNELITIYKNTVPYSQKIYARLENMNSCFGISGVTLTVKKLPNIETEATASYCLNKFPETITLNAGILPEDSPNNYTYLWSNGDTSYTTNINAAGVYTVTVTDKKGCSKIRTVNVKPSNIATITEINATDVTEKNTITVLATGEGSYQYALYDIQGNMYLPYQTSNVFNDIYPGIYNVYVKETENNCGIAIDQVSVIGFPKFFTPNGDGINDTWQIIGISEMFQPNTNITIYDRFGKLVKQLDPLGEGWNGYFNGHKLPSDDYWFAVKLQDGRIFKSHFSLKY